MAFISHNYLLIAGIASSILLAGFFAASETAVVFSNKSRLRSLADAGNGRAVAALRLVQERNRLHTSLLLAENFFIVLAVVLCVILAMRIFSWDAVAAGASAVFMSVIVVFFAKLAPKGVASRNPDRLTLLVSFPLLSFMKLLSPLARILAGAADFFVGPGPQGLSCTAVVTEEDIKAMINLGEEGGALKEEEKELLHKVFEFGDTLASEAMRPRTEIVSIPADAAIHDALRLVSEYGYSRYPVIEDTVDSIIGILYVKDILIAMSAGDMRREDPIRRFVRPAYFIPENKRVSELLSEMQREKFQIAIVIDEYGGTAGLVTLEDLIEEIVGSIHDELDTADREVEIVDEKTFVVSGQSELDEVNEQIGAQLQSKDFNTIGGFVFGLFGRMPKVGEQLRYKDLKIEVLELEGRKIEKVKITKL